MFFAVARKMPDKHQFYTVGKILSLQTQCGKLIFNSFHMDFYVALLIDFPLELVI